jgi:hypothetical protein
MDGSPFPQRRHCERWARATNPGLRFDTTRGGERMRTVERPLEKMSQAQLAADIRLLLLPYAASRSVVTYGEIVELLKAMWPERYARLFTGAYVFHQALGEISQDTLRRLGFALTAIVVTKYPERRSEELSPGEGFDTLCGSGPRLDWREE